jgi:hypothetical protein
MGVNDFEYSQEMLESILQVVHDITVLDYQDFCIPQENYSVYDVWNNADLIVKTLLIRAFYKGMAGDVKMLIDFAVIWKERFKKEEWKGALCELFHGMMDVRLFEFQKKYQREHVLLEGVDFHCSDMIEWIVGQLENGENGFDCQESFKRYLKKIIWDLRSSVNFRKGLFCHVNLGKLVEGKDACEREEDVFYLNQVLHLIERFSQEEIDKRFRRDKLIK